MKKTIFLLFSIVLFLYSCKSAAVPEKTVELPDFKPMFEELYLSPDIRVKLIKGNEVSIVSDYSSVLTDYITGREIREFKELSLKFENNKCYVNGNLFTSALAVKSMRYTPLKINNRLYFGEIRIFPGENGIELINVLPIELYLLSVLPSEMPAFFEIEALKAQSIVARTYAYYFIIRSVNSRRWDVDNTTSFQVYNGFNDILGNKIFLKLYDAVSSTSGRIVTYNNEPIIAYFHANSGGYLTSGRDYFGHGSDFPYLTEKDDVYSVDMNGYRWEYTASFSELKEKTGIVFNDNIDVTLNKYGVVDSVVFEDRVYTPKMIRRAYNYRNIRSEKFNFEIGSENVRFTGFGFGHGVGMSQWGAQNMGLKGFSYSDIIGFYYPETAIVSY